MAQLIVRVDRSSKLPRIAKECEAVWCDAQLFVVMALREHGVRGHLKLTPLHSVGMSGDGAAAVSMRGKSIHFEYRPKGKNNGWSYMIGPDRGKYPPPNEILNAISGRIISQQVLANQPVAATHSLSLPKLSTSDNSIIATTETPMMSNGAPNKSIQKIDLHETGDLLKSVVTAVDRIHSNRTALEEKTKKLANLREDFQRLKLEINSLEDSIGYLKIQIDDDQEGKQAETFMAQVAAFSKMTR